MISWFVRNGVAANLLMLTILISGLAAIQVIKVELFPQFSLDAVSVTVPFRGASPEEVEEQIIERIEEEIQDVEGIKELTATAREGSGTVTAEVEKGYDPTELRNNIETRVNSINTFPVDAERPVVEELIIKREVLGLAIFGDTDERTLKELAEETRDEILKIPGITQVEVSGVRNYEIAIEVTEEALRRHGLSFTDVENAVRNNSIDLPGGNLKTRGGEILLRTKGQAYTGPDFESIVLMTNPDGSRVTIGDVANVNDGFEDEELVSTFSGKPASFLVVYEVGNQNPLDIAEKIHAYTKEAQKRLPEGIQIEAWRDITHYLTGRLQMLIENGIIGLILVFGVLTLFLRPSLAMWVSIGIPVSFLGAFLLMPWLDASINLISLFGFILVLGIVVDDAIVVGESVFTEFQRNGPGVESSIRGAHAVATPVTFAVLTTMIAFTPLLNLPGFMGKFLGDIPLVVITVLVFSLIESKLILPYHLSLLKVGDKKKRDKLGKLSRLQRKVADSLEYVIKNHYKPFLKVCLQHRYVTLSLFIALLAVVISLVAGGHVRVVPFPSVPSDYIFANIVYPEGTPPEITRRGHERVLTALDEIIDETIEAGRPDPVDHISTGLGYTVRGGRPGGTHVASAQSHIASVVL